MALTIDENEEFDHRRERKKLETRRALRRAALDLITARGYAHVTVEDIAAAVDVSTRTFFNYFPSKDAAIVGWEIGLIGRVSERLRNAPSTAEPLDAVRDALIAELEFLVSEDSTGHPDGREAWRERIAVIGSEPHLLAAQMKAMCELEGTLSAVVAERLGVESAAVYPALVAAAALAALRVALVRWKTTGEPTTLTTLVTGTFEVLAAGLKPAAATSLGELVARSRRLR